MKHLSFIMLATVLLLSCTGHKNPSNQSSVPRISAVIYEPDGTTGADGAVVKIFDACDTGGEPLIVTITDEEGRYYLDELADGVYNFWAEKDSFVLLQDSVPVSSMQTTLKDDTLECPSTLTGIVALEDFHDTRSVTIRIAGFDKPVIIADAAGTFTLTGLAEGTWPLQLRSTIPDYLPTSAAVNISACSNDTIDDTLRLYYTGIPVVGGITYEQDTLTGTIRLSWEKPAYKMVRDYLIYIASCSEIVFSKEPTFITEDTFYIDSIFAALPFDPLDTTQRCLTYRIAIRNTMQKIGATCFQVEVPYAPKASVATFFTHEVHYENDTINSASLHDTVTISLAARSRTRALHRLYWYDPAKKDTVAERTVDDTLAKEFIDTLRYAFDSLGTNRLVAIAVDDAGIRWSDTVSVKIVNDTLSAYAGNDTGVLSCDTVHLHGVAKMKYGKVAVWEWKIGAGYWIKTSGPDTAIAASELTSISQTVVCSLAVTDDDGNRAVDKMHIRVDVIPEPITEKIIAGGFHNLLLDGNKSLTGQGINWSGQLGGKSIGEWVAMTPMMDNVKSMDAGANYTLMTGTDGGLWACGDNSYGQLGTGTLDTQFVPVKVMSDVQSTAAGSFHTLILSADGTLRACGSNRYGQLGDSTTTDRRLPVQVMTDVLRAAAGGSHSLILKTDGSLWACGANDYGQLGDGTNEKRLFPVPVMTGVRSMAAGGMHSLILKNDGSLWACGWNYAGQLGDSTTMSKNSPLRVMTDVEEISAGDYHSLILKTDGTLWACGENGMGQLGDSTTTDRFVPVKVMSNVRSADAGKWHSLILQKTGAVWICGWVSYNADTYGGTEISSIRKRLIPEEW